MSQRFVATKEIIFVCENKHDTFLHRLILLVHQTRLKSTYSIQIVDSSVHLLVPNNHGVFLLKMIIWGVKWGEPTISGNTHLLVAGSVSSPMSFADLWDLRQVIRFVSMKARLVWLWEQYYYTRHELYNVVQSLLEWLWLFIVNYCTDEIHHFGKTIVWNVVFSFHSLHDCSIAWAIQSAVLQLLCLLLLVAAAVRQPKGSWWWWRHHHQNPTW